MIHRQAAARAAVGAGPLEEAAPRARVALRAQPVPLEEAAQRAQVEVWARAAALEPPAEAAQRAQLVPQARW